MLHESGDDFGGVWLERVGVVEHEHERSLDRLERRREPRHRSAAGAEVRPTEAALGLGDEIDEQGLTGPPAIERHEREGTFVPLCPLREQRRLAVPGGGDECDDRLRARGP